MSALDLSHSPSIEAVIIGLDNRTRFDLVESESLDQNIPAFAQPSFRTIEEGGDVSYSADDQNSHNNENVLAFLPHNSKIEAQEIASQPDSSKEPAIKKGIAIVASASESVGSDEALVRLDQNGDGRINQIEVQKGVRADEESSTFAALSQYQRSLEIYQKLSESDEFGPTKLFNDNEVKVEKLFDDENLDQDLYQDQSEKARQEDAHPEQQTEVVV
ncbi:MAG: hypothetical protein HON14_06320 [Rhodospirillaceae bacterium]|nr:hypothetical protein [Rhodospirillaceae bacterium]MBT4938729.1 hypothetical protein [Rhodospirillaceae bacterium]MBT5939686.1 hypothetical protein [Rhodospirillaceae bacterium]MBT7266759.1 hypothetical protein [Rhodospirillaceae bacterium]